MKVRLNKQTLAQMPEAVRSIVAEWKARTRRTFISVENVQQFYPGEDAKVTMLNLTTGVSQYARAAGEWAGMTRLSPTAAVPLPVGIVAIVTEIFLGQHYLTIYQGSAPQIEGGAK
jgi:hypothetical protein